MQQPSNRVMSGSLIGLWLHSFGFGTAICLLRRNQKVDVIVLVYLWWIHSLVLPHIPFFLNCVTPDFHELHHSR
jgi:hypothetical protein